MNTGDDATSVAQIVRARSKFDHKGVIDARSFVDQKGGEVIEEEP
jgi:hypothetical protein